MATAANIEGGLPALPLDAPQGVHAHRHDDGAVRLVLPLERHRHEVEADGTVGVGDGLALGRPPARPGRAPGAGAVASVLAMIAAGAAAVIVMDCTAGTALR